MQKKNKSVIKVRINTALLQTIVSWVISLGTLMAGLSFVLGDMITSFEAITFGILIISFVLTSIYIFFVQRKQKNHDKTRFFIFALIVILVYIIVTTVASIRFYIDGQLAISAFWLRILIASNFAVSLIFWQFVKGNKIYKTPVYAFMTGTTLASLYFITVNIFNIPSSITPNKELLSILAAGTLAITMIQQHQLITKKDKAFGFCLFVINSLTLILAQNMVAMLALTIAVAAYSIFRSSRRYKSVHKPGAFFPLLINIVILVMLNTTYFLISLNYTSQFAQLIVKTPVINSDSLVILLLFSTFIGKLLMKELRIGSVAILVLIVASMFMTLGDLTLVALATLLALNLSQAKT